MSDALAHCAKIYVDKIESLSCTVRVFVVVARNSREGRSKEKKGEIQWPFPLSPEQEREEVFKKSTTFPSFPRGLGYLKKNKNISISTLTGIDFILNLCVCMYECLWVCLPHVYSVQRDQKGH